MSFHVLKNIYIRSELSSEMKFYDAKVHSHHKQDIIESYKFLLLLYFHVWDFFSFSAGIERVEVASYEAFG